MFHVEHKEEENMDYTQIAQCLEEHGVPHLAAYQMQRYALLLQEANRTRNLTRIKDPEEMVYKHLLDSISVEKYIPINATVLDVGTGAGLPGIPLVLLRPDIKISMMDSTKSKLDFVAEVSQMLNIRAKFIWGRAEEFAKKNRDCYDIVLSRAVATLPLLLELCGAFVKKGGYVIAYKGRLAAEEALEATRAANHMGLEKEMIRDAEIPGLDHKLIFYKKTSLGNLPRTWGAMKRKPL